VASELVKKYRSNKSVDLESIDKIDPPETTKSTIRKASMIVSERTAQKINQLFVGIDDSKSMETYQLHNQQTMAELLAWAKREPMAALVDLTICTVANATQLYGPERFSEFSNIPTFSYEYGSNAGQGLKQLLDCFDENRSKYRRSGIAFAHDYCVSDPELLMEQSQRVKEYEKKYPTTFEFFPIGIGNCDVVTMSKISSRRPGKQLSDDGSLKEVFEFIKRFTMSLTGRASLD
jgi:uncharacterized protein YegL